MTLPKLTDRLAVCSWSLQPTGPGPLLEHLRALGIPRLQIALDPLRADPRTWGPTAELCRAQGVQLVSGMMVTAGEDYSTMDSIRRTGGIVPDATWEENRAHFQANLAIARDLGLKLVTFHAGFLPDDTRDPGYVKLRDRLARVADMCRDHGLDLGLETGQETAPHLLALLEGLDRPNLGVNFDPANMILYDKGDPIEALRILGPWLKQCHIKDANRTRQPGTWGEEVTVGTGQVNWPAFFQTLRNLKYQGWLAIEREAGNQRPADIATARSFLETLPA